MSDLEIKVSQDLIKGIVEQKIRAGIVNEFNKNSAQILEGLVMNALNQKVSRDGTVSRYSSDNSFNWVEAESNRLVMETAREVLKSWIIEKTPEIKKAVEKELTKQKSAMVQAFVNNVIKEASSNYNFKFSVSAEKNEKY